MSTGSEAYRRQAILTSSPSDTVRLCLETALREGILLSTGPRGDRDRLVAYGEIVALEGMTGVRITNLRDVA